jgi:hypothetical protein
MKTLICIVFSIAILPAFGAFGDSAANPQGDDAVSIQLGKVSVKGQRQVLRALQAIKVGLHTPLSGAKKDRNKIVCRIEEGLGSHAHQILTCAPNWVLTKQRMEIQTNIMAVRGSVPSGATAAIQAQEVLESLTATQPQHEFSLEVTSNFRPFLDRLPDLPPAASTLVPAAKPSQP